jgi:hypothetical protein
VVVAVVVLEELVQLLELAAAVAVVVATQALPTLQAASIH